MARKPAHPDHYTMSFGDHLDDLRRSVMYAVGGILPLFFIALYYSRELIQVVTYPVRHALKQAHLPASLQSTGVFETFNASMQVALMLTIVLGSPWILWQVWRFISPGLHRHEKRFVHILLPLSGLLTLTSIAFFYFVVLPIILTFMIDWGVMAPTTKAVTAPLPAGVVLPNLPMLDVNPTDARPGDMWFNKEDQRINVAIPGPDGSITVYGIDLGPTAMISPDYRVREYLSTLITMAMSFAVAFQTPVVVLMLGWVGIIDTTFIAKYRRHALLASLVAGILLTPGDPMSFILVVVPVYLLYELGGLLLRIMPADRVARGFLTRKAPPPDDDMAEDPPRADRSLPPASPTAVHRNGDHADEP